MQFLNTCLMLCFWTYSSHPFRLSFSSSGWVSGEAIVLTSCILDGDAEGLEQGLEDAGRASGSLYCRGTAFSLPPPTYSNRFYFCILPPSLFSHNCIILPDSSHVVKSICFFLNLKISIVQVLLVIVENYR